MCATGIAAAKHWLKPIFLSLFSIISIVYLIGMGKTPTDSCFMVVYVHRDFSSVCYIDDSLVFSMIIDFVLKVTVFDL